MLTNTFQEKLLIRYFLLVFVISIPFWLFGGNRLPLPVNLPVSSLMFICPALAALILSYRNAGRDGMKELLRKIFSSPNTKKGIWYLPALLLMPTIYFLSYVIMRWTGMPLPDARIPLMAVPVFFIMYFITAIGEELGWMGYAVEQMQNRWGALKSSVILGCIWAVWHIIPHWQQSLPANWILWQSIHSVALRILIVWIYNNTGKNLLAAILVHTMDNVSWSLFPNYGSHYDPLVTGAITCLTALIVILVWGSKTLDQYRYAQDQVRWLRN